MSQKPRDCFLSNTAQLTKQKLANLEVPLNSCYTYGCCTLGLTHYHLQIRAYQSFVLWQAKFLNEVHIEVPGSCHMILLSVWAKNKHRSHLQNPYHVFWYDGQAESSRSPKANFCSSLRASLIFAFSVPQTLMSADTHLDLHTTKGDTTKFFALLLYPNLRQLRPACRTPEA